MILATVAVFAYIGVQGLSSKVSSNVDSGSAYDELAALKSEYASLSPQLDAIKSKTRYASKKVKADVSKAQIELVKANSAITDVESALSSNLPNDEVVQRLSVATNQLQVAKDNINKVKSEV